MTLDKYRKLEKVGEGTYGIVYKAVIKETGSLVALKKIRLEADEEGVPSTAIREICLLRELRQENIVDLIDVIHSPEHLYLVFEFVDCDLKKFIDTRKEGLDPALIRSFMRQMMEGILYCHDRRILHRDLKPQNILIAAGTTLKLADFGLGRVVSLPLRTYTHEVVTMWYRAPEILLGHKHYSAGMDMWSIGCIFAEMFLTKALFPGDSEIDQIFRICRVLGTPTMQSWPKVAECAQFHEKDYPKWSRRPLEKIVPDMGKEGWDLLGRLLTYEEMERISSREAITHPYFGVA